MIDEKHFDYIQRLTAEQLEAELQAREKAREKAREAFLRAKAQENARREVFGQGAENLSVGV